MSEAAPSVENAESTLRLRGVGRRFGGLLAVSDVEVDAAHREKSAEAPADPPQAEGRLGVLDGRCCFGHRPT